MNLKYYFTFIFLICFFASGNILEAELNYEEFIIGRHADECLGVFVNDENTMVASGSLDETIKLWSLPEGKEIKTLVGHLGAVNNISFSGNDSLLASASSDLTVKIWDIASGKAVETLKGHTDKVIGCYFSQDTASTFVASGSFDKTIKFWDVSLGKEIKTLYGHDLAVNNVAYSYDGHYIASCSDDKTIKLWSTDMTTKIPIKTMTGHTAPVLSVIYSFDSKLLASCDEAGYIFIWQMPQGTLLRKIKAHDDLVQDCSFAEDNKTLVSGGLDKKLKLWNVETGENIYTREINSEIWSVDLTSNADILVAGCADGTVRYYAKPDMAAKIKAARSAVKPADSQTETKQDNSKKAAVTKKAAAKKGAKK